MALDTHSQDLINTYLAKGGNVTECKTYYPKRYEGTQDTRDTIGEQITTLSTPHTRYNSDGDIIGVYYEATSWIHGMNIKARNNIKDMLPTIRKTKWFRLKLRLQYHTTKREKRQLRRDIARAKNNISKNGIVKRKAYTKRAIPCPPSKVTLEG